MRIGDPVDLAPFAFRPWPADREFQEDHNDGHDRQANADEHRSFTPGIGAKQPNQEQAGQPEPGIAGMSEKFQENRQPMPVIGDAQRFGKLCVRLQEGFEPAFHIYRSRSC